MVKNVPPPPMATPDSKAPFGSAARRAAMNPGPRKVTADHLMREAGIFNGHTLILSFFSPKEMDKLTDRILREEDIPYERRIETNIFLNNAMAQEMDIRLRDDKLEAKANENIADDLTGLNLRRPLAKALDKVVADINGDDKRKNKKQYVVAFIDLKKFKAINDLHGEGAGDEALQHVADILKRTVRSVDVLCRYGGDEFVVLGKITQAHDAERFAQRLQDAIGEMSFNFTDPTKGTTVPIEFGARVGIFPIKPGQTPAVIMNDASIAASALKDAEDRTAHLKKPVVSGGGAPEGAARAPAML